MNKIGQSINISSDWQREYQLLKNLGFVPLDDSGSESDNEPPAFDVDYEPEDIVLIESEVDRNQFCFVLRGTGDYDLYVQHNIGCGFCRIPLRWAEIEYEWLNNLYKGIRGNGFAWKPIDIGEPNVNTDPYGVEFLHINL